ncbi:eukaryotic translation initiation factor 5A-like [Phlebotomus argentipes]|uniref:eukaryotic translation initiation factor 5A-like n=1 Tax=Phlebotomus argentipes TaxID=94469 RepID=UPI0028937500|nr:eukaryotic translation initiation factor 5A-like [Phlebotomus argentipes]
MTTFARRARISSLALNDCIVLEGRPCRIAEKYPNGYNKLFIAAMDLFTGECYERNIDVRERFDVPHVFRVHYKLVNISEDGQVTLLSRSGAIRSGLKLPNSELGETIKRQFNELLKEGGLDFEFNNNFQVTVTQSMGEEHITSFGVWEDDA